VLAESPFNSRAIFVSSSTDDRIGQNFASGLGAEELIQKVLRSAEPGSPRALCAPAKRLLPSGYGAIRESICRERRNVKLLAVDSGLFDPYPESEPPLLEDIGLLRALPEMKVVVPSDGPTLRSAIASAFEVDGPVYLRLNGGEVPDLTDGTFHWGKAVESREGSDVTLIAAGPILGEALVVSKTLEKVGIGARVLDLASVKPFDEKAILRAARDTGALLTLEDHSSLTGIGALVTATTAENYPVPVRRLGVPDLFARPGRDASIRARYGLDAASVRDETWELLRLRGKVQ
jgi:transketolase